MRRGAGRDLQDLQGLASRPLDSKWQNMKRPAHVKPPKHLSKSPPLPQPAEGQPEEEERSPTRYGDWEKKGIAIDF